MNVIFSTIAVEELNDAINFYNLESVELSDRFEDEKKSINRILEYPYSWSIEKWDIRKCLLHKFPYKILSSVEDNHIFVIAVAHQHRKPDYWVDRES